MALLRQVYMKSNHQKSVERGAILAEFAIVLPILLLLLMGVTEFGLLFYNKQVLTNASREGARAGIAYSTPAEIEDIVENYCEKRLISVGPVSVNTPVISGGVSYPNDLKVTVTYDYTFIVPKLLGFAPTKTLSASTEMRMESFDPAGT